VKSRELIKLKSQFDNILNVIDESSLEYWYARDLMVLLGYSKWDNFVKVIEKAVISCENAGIDSKNHFADVGKMVDIGSSSKREIDDVMLTRYACYLIAQNGDPRKDEIAFAQTYFAVQTRKQEIIEEHIELQERLKARQKLTESETELSKNIYERGVDDSGFGRIRSKDDQVLFGGFTTQEMKNKLAIPQGRPLTDFLPTITIAAKNLATEMTNFKVKQNELLGEDSITDEHIQNNKSVRGMLGDRGIKPEELAAEEDLKKLERRVRSTEKKIIKESELPRKIASKFI
jgi:DNA-damage-inducible protein D